MSIELATPPISPGTGILMNEHKPDDDNIEWTLCCSKSSKSFIKYLTTVLMSVIVLIFCIIQIILNTDQNNSIYFALISSIVSLYVPAPTLDKTN